MSEKQQIVSDIHDTLKKLRIINYPWLHSNPLEILYWIQQTYHIEYAKRFSGMWEARYKDTDDKIIWSVLKPTADEVIEAICDYVLSPVFRNIAYGEESNVSSTRAQETSS